jgi:hypothetical protein
MRTRRWFIPLPFLLGGFCGLMITFFIEYGVANEIQSYATTWEGACKPLAYTNTGRTVTVSFDCGNGRRIHWSSLAMDEALLRNPQQPVRCRTQIGQILRDETLECFTVDE